MTREQAKELVKWLEYGYTQFSSEEMCEELLHYVKVKEFERPEGSQTHLPAEVCWHRVDEMFKSNDKGYVWELNYTEHYSSEDFERVANRILWIAASIQPKKGD
jgi:hypothetical protein